MKKNALQSLRMLLLLGAILLLSAPTPAWAMHISEGILPAGWAALWFLVSLPFLYLGLRDIRRRTRENPAYKSFVALTGAAVFIISCMPIPVPVAGTCSHPCGTGLAAILIGPGPTVVVSAIALLFQALFLAHGGLTTLGANMAAMGVAGAFAGYGAFLLAKRFGLSFFWAAFLGGVISDWATYSVTSLTLAAALHGTTAFGTLFLSILTAFVPTQLPLGILEGFLSAGALRFVLLRRPGLLPKSLSGEVTL